MKHELRETYTIEDLREIAYRGSYNDMERALARQLLAAHEQEPVGIVHGVAQTLDGSSFVAMVECKTRPSDGTEFFAHPAPSIPAMVPDELRNRLKAQGIEEVLKDAKDYAPLTAGQWETLTNNWHQTFIGLADRYAELDACRAAMLQSEPVIQPYKLPDGYCVMPCKLSAENGAKCALSGEFHVTHRIVCQSCGGEGCEDCNEEGGWDGEILIGWDIIKQIHEASVEACALPAAPKGV